MIDKDHTYDRLIEKQNKANQFLKKAIFDERSRRWDQVVMNYRELLKLLLGKNLPKNLNKNRQLRMMKFESFYHLGLALQNLGKHDQAVKAYTNATDQLDLRKVGCSAGCISNICLQTPVLARRSLAYSQTGETKSAFKDIEQAIVLDAKNFDLYCVRALLWNTIKEHKKAKEDIDFILKKTKNSHTCALLLKGNISETMIGEVSSGIIFEKKSVNKNIHRQMAVQRHPEASTYFSVVDVNNRHMLRFWDRFLWSLNVPRTINYVDLTSQYIQDCKDKIVPFTDKQFHKLQSFDPKQKAVSAFRCGTAHLKLHSGDRNSTVEQSRRRNSYGEAVRAYSAINCDDSRVYRLKTSNLRSESTSKSQSYQPRLNRSRTKHIKLSATNIKPNQDNFDFNSSVVSSMYGVSCFTNHYHDNAPRLYHKPWEGDKLPTREKMVFESFKPPFR